MEPPTEPGQVSALDAFQQLEEEITSLPLNLTAVPATVHDDGLVVCDPGTVNPAKGANVPFSQSHSFVDKSRDLGQITCILVVGR